jgi:hypothetical protein
MYVRAYVMTTRVKDVAGKDTYIHMLNVEADAEPMPLARVVKNWTRVYRDISNEPLVRVVTP